MRAVVLEPAFGLDNVKVAAQPEPEPGTGEVLLEMRAASLNYRDLLVSEGSYHPRQALPLILASDGVGIVRACGDGVTRVRIGDRVCPIFAPTWLDGTPSLAELRTTLGSPLHGTLCERMVVHENSVVHVPAYLSDVEAATLPCAFVTAWSALVTLGQLIGTARRNGEHHAEPRVLCLGTGGVSVSALQLALSLGAKVAVTSSSDEKLERALGLGADFGLNYLSVPNWGRAIRDWAGGEGVDHVIEVGGADTLGQSLKAVRAGGQISLIGVLAGTTTPINLLEIVMRHVRVQGVLVGHRASFEALNAHLDRVKLHPVIDRVFDLNDARAALMHLRSQQHFGKVCIQIAN